MQASSVTDNINSVTGKKSSSGVSQNYEDFLKLLTVQLQNQDPTAPTDTNQLTQQIATLSQVEQQINTNQNLEKLISLFNATQYNSVVSYIGKQIEAPGDVGALQNSKATFAYYLERDADRVEITIKDAAGNVVNTTTGTTLTGRNEYKWDGKNSQGQQMADGTYKIEVKAVDANNNAITSKTYTTGVVTSVDTAGGQVYLSFGDISVPLGSVISIRQAPNQI
ncbi:MAG: flagellar hook assembly protein FlgD [Alphaproteobacteria bacterium]